LKMESKLNAAAQGHADDMSRRNYYAHSSPEGKSVADRYQKAGGSKWLLTAENIAKCADCKPPLTDRYLAQLQEGWMNSPGHRKNILHKGLATFGYGIVVTEKGGLYAVQNFAGPGIAGDEASSGGEKDIGPAEQTAQALAKINAERKKAGLASLSASDTLAAVARSMLPARNDAEFSLDKSKDLFEQMPSTERKKWGAISMLAAICGGCGVKPTSGDVGYFIGQWLGQAQHREMALSPEFTHWGFAIGADGAGKKMAIGVLGEAQKPSSTN
jgi:uncharacterized protein YkwD